MTRVSVVNVVREAMFSKCDEKKSAPLGVIGRLEVQGNGYMSIDAGHINGLRGGCGCDGGA